MYVGTIAPSLDSVNVASGERDRTIGSEKATWIGARSMTSTAPGDGVREMVGGVRSTTMVTGADFAVSFENATSAVKTYDASTALVVSHEYS